MNTLEKLIHQKSFSSQNHKAIISLLYTAYLIRDKHDQLFEKYGLTSQQFNVLRILRGKHPAPATITWVKERLLDKNSDTSRVIDRMVKAGLISKVVSETDRRAADLQITDTGLKLLSLVDCELPNLESVMTCLSNSEINQLIATLDKLLEKVIQ